MRLLQYSPMHLHSSISYAQVFRSQSRAGGALETHFKLKNFAIRPCQ